MSAQPYANLQHVGLVKLAPIPNGDPIYQAATGDTHALAG